MKIGDFYISLDYSSVSPYTGSSITGSSFTSKFSGYMHSFVSMLKERRSLKESSEVGVNTEYTPKRKFNKENIKRHIKSIVIAAVIVLVIVMLGKSLFRVGGTSKAETPEVKPALATLAINKEFSFPLTSSDGDKVADVKFMIENAELRNEIIVSGQRATSIKGRQFLVLTVKISNEYKSAIQINTRDYVRLAVNGNENEWLAPEIHNDPVEVQAISTKYTRLGFAINESDKNLIVRIGEINGNKEVIPLEFR